MACTNSKGAELKLCEYGALPKEMRSACDIVLVGCGGAQTQPEGLYDLELQLYDTTCLVPTLVIPGQRDDLILGSNVIKHLLHVMKATITTGTLPQKTWMSALLMLSISCPCPWALNGGRVLICPIRSELSSLPKQPL